MFAVLLPQNVSTCTVEITQYALKGQKLLAQGSALGIMPICKAPCKVGCSKFESKIRYKKWCYFGAAKLLIFNTLIYEIVLWKFA